jgi:cell division protein FtsL
MKGEENSSQATHLWNILSGMEKLILRPLTVAALIALIKIVANAVYFLHYAGNIRGIQDSFQESLFSTSDGDVDRIRKVSICENNILS